MPSVAIQTSLWNDKEVSLKKKQQFTKRKKKKINPLSDDSRVSWFQVKVKRKCA